jgi:hypothetical protein
VNAIAVVILICSATLSRSECQLNTASDVMRAPNVANEIMCALSGQSMLAATALAPTGRDEYVNIVCIRSRQTAKIAPSRYECRP